MVLYVTAFSLTFPADCSLVLCSASILVTNGSMRRYLLPNQVTQVVQLHLNSRSTHVAWGRFQESGRGPGGTGGELPEPYKGPPAGYWWVYVSDQTVQQHRAAQLAFASEHHKMALSSLHR